MLLCGPGELNKPELFLFVPQHIVKLHLLWRKNKAEIIMRYGFILNPYFL